MRQVEEELRALREAALSGMEDRDLAILDVGAGRDSAFRVEGARLVGLDPSATELALNADLDERVVSTIEDAELVTGAFDVVVMWEVLELSTSQERHYRRSRRRSETAARSSSPLRIPCHSKG